MNIYVLSGFFPLSFKKCNKLNEYIYTYFFIIPIIPFNNFFYNKDCYIVSVIEIDNHG